MIVQADVAVRRAGLNIVALETTGVRLRRMPTVLRAILGRRVQAITLNRTVFINAAHYDAVVAGSDPVLLVHELVHVSQWRDNGVFCFSARYLSDYVRLRMLGIGHDAAYRGIGFEHAAYDAASQYESLAA
ncbi:MAG: DUF4157 domain-containing protein [Actinomycetia bacterium]|nr:DUF4157 domain-containing protein [Actinomycetes bacterium]